MAQKRSAFDWLLEVLSFLLLLLIVGVVLIHWPGLPARIPTHFSASGQPDRWGDKSGVFALPAIAAGLYLLLTIIPRYPQFINVPFEIDRTAPPVRSLLLTMTIALKLEILIVFFYIEHAVIRAHGLGTAFLPASLLAIFSTLAFFLLRLRKHRM